jgi:peptide/nickel transport system substrate-binding protein
VIEDVEKVDETTIRVTMKEAGSSALYALNFPILYSDASENQLIGTGPYKIQSSTDEEITLTINTNWWKQEPYIERIRCLVRDSNEVAIASYNAGQLSMVPTSNVFVGRYREDGVTEVLDVMTQTAEILLFNQRNTVLKDVNVRKAIAYALDRNSVVTNVYMHHASVCDVPIAPDSFLYDPTSKVYDYNLTMAQTLLAKAGWEDVDSDGILENINQPAYELKLKLLVNETAENTLRKSAATLIASQLSQIGIMVEVETEAFSLGDTSSRYQRRLQEGNFDLAMVGFNVRQSGDLREYLLSDGSQNYAGYSNDRMDQYLQQAVNAVDEKSMVETQSQLQQEIVDTLPFMTLYFRMNSIVYDSSIKNVSEIREPDVLRTVSKWYIQQQ